MSSGEDWNTPTGRRLGRRILGSAISGTPVLLRTRRVGIDECLSEESLHSACDVRHLDAALEPLKAVAALAGFGDRMARNGSLLSLIGGAALRHSVLVVALEGFDPEPWLSFAGLFASARKQFPEAAAGLVLTSRSALREPRGCARMSDDTIVDDVDATWAMRNWSEWSRSLFNDAAAAIAVEISRGDLDLLRAMAAAGPETCFDPRRWLADAGPVHSPRPLRWRGREEPHPGWLVLNDPDAIQRRRWRGQLGLVLPWLESVRIDYLDRLRPSGWSEDLEFTPLIEQLQRRGGAAKHLKALRTLRTARNDLAHGRPLEAEQTTGLEPAAQTLTH